MKKHLLGLLIILGFSSILFTNKIVAQTCSTKPILLKDFSKGSTQYSKQKPSNFGFSTTYIQEFGKDGMEADAYFDDKTQDGEFSFINSLPDYWNVWHGGAQDHTTGDVGGYMMLVNASFSPGEFYRDTVDGLCSGINYEFSVYMANADRFAGRILPNIKFQVLDYDTGNPIATGSSGNILANTGGTLGWTKQALNFKSTTDKVIILLINNNGGGNGNDLVLDDIAFTPCVPTYIIPKDKIYCLGTKISIPVNANSSNDTYVSPVYQWQKKNGLVWEDIVGATNQSIDFDSVLVENEGWYRVHISDPGNLNKEFCSSVDSIFLKTTETKILPQTSTVSYCQFETALPLTAVGIGKMQYYTEAIKGIAYDSYIPNTTILDTVDYYVSQIINTCESNRVPLTVQIKQAPTMEVPENQSLCNGVPTNIEKFASSFNSVTFAWSNSISTIGINSTGTGNIPSFISNNNTDTIQNAIITVTPSITTCKGKPETFKYTIYPTPKVTNDTYFPYCNRDLTSEINLSSNTPNTTFSWTNDNTSIGLSGSGDNVIPSFTITNNDSLPKFANITIKPTAKGCEGTFKTISYVVYPSTPHKYKATFTEDEESVNIVDTLNFKISHKNINYVSVKLLNNQLYDTLTVKALPSGINATKIFNQNKVSILFTGVGTVADFENAVKAIEFKNYSQKPDTNTREISIVINDSIISCSSTISKIKVISINDAPIIKNEFYTIEVEKNKVFPGLYVEYLNNDTDIDSDSLRGNQIVKNAQNGTVSFVDFNNGLFKYVPNIGFSGTEKIIIEICDTGFPSPVKCGYDTITIVVITNNIPTGFSPNGDGKNDNYIISYPELWGKANLEIYNRWGSLVFEKEDYKGEWDGTSNKGITFGNELPDGIYFVSLKFPNHTSSNQVYAVTLLR